MQKIKHPRSPETHPALRFDADTLDRIMRVHEPEAGVLSVYLDVEPSQMQREGFEAALLDLWKPLRSQVQGTDAEARVEEEIAGVNGYVRSWKEPPGRAVAMFASAPSDTFMPVALDVPVLAGARFGPRPFLMPLIAALDEHERYCVALVDKKKARILTVWMGQIERQSQFEDDVPGRTAVGGWGGWSQAGYAQHREYHVHAHMRRVVDELWRLSRRGAFDRLIIGGPDEALAALKATLTRPLASKLAGEFAGEMFGTDAAIVERVHTIEQGIERGEEKALVEEIIVRAAKGQLAVTGWDDALTALGEGRVHRLALIEGETAEGYGCPDAHVVVRERIERCPMCGKAIEPVRDVAAAAVRLAMITDAHVEFVRGEAAKMLRPYGAGAVLRYQ
jgi:hypothetical protein